MWRWLALSISGLRESRLLTMLADAGLLITGVPLMGTVVFGVIMAYRTYHPPRPPLRKRPQDLGLPCRDITIPTLNGKFALSGWYIPAAQPAATVIVSHGVGQHKGFTLPYVSALHEAGYNVLAFDLRNHGGSDFDWRFWGMSRRFTDDMEAAISQASEMRGAGDSGMALLAFSFSTYPALHVMKRAHGALRAIICDSGPTIEVRELPKRFLDAGRIPVPRLFRRPVLYRCMTFAYAAAVNLMLWVDWPPRWASAPCSLLFIANERDSLIPAGDVKALADIYQGTEFWVAPQSEHLLAIRRNREAYTNRILPFLKRALAPGSCAAATAE